MYRYIWSCLLVMVITAVANAETYYVATDGNENNNGTKEKPWPSVKFALSKTGGGHTIIVKPGIYRGPITIAKQYAGTKDRPTVIKSEVKWKAVIIGADYHVINILGDWVVVDGFETLGARYDGIKIQADFGVVRNCWVHNNTSMGIAAHGWKGSIIENNLVEYNGCHIQFDHGIYADGADLTIRGNIVRHNAGYGIHLYSAVTNSLIANNLVYGHEQRPGLLVACPNGGGKNIIINNTIVRNKIAIMIWNGNKEIVMNNILMASDSAFCLEENTKDIISDYNLCVPQSEYQGPNGISDNPMFVDDGHGVFWLKAGSPAVGKGTLQYAPTTDFWGRPIPKDKPSDIGAFPFISSLSDLSDWESRQKTLGWPFGWAYLFNSDAGLEMHDLWTLPVVKEKK